jgi:hypothetical protein
VSDAPARFLDALNAAHERAGAAAAEATRLARRRDRDGLRALADRIRSDIKAAAQVTGGHFQLRPDHRGVIDEAYDTAFPVTDPFDPADVLDAPWDTASRRIGLDVLVASPWPSGRPYRDALVDSAVAAGDVRLLRLVVASPVGLVQRESVRRALDALDGLGTLDPATLEQAFTDDVYLGNALTGRASSSDPPGPPAACLATARDTFDELTWRRLAEGAGWDELPKVIVPRGLRFVLRALTTTDPNIAKHIGAAELTDEERTALVGQLENDDDRRKAFQLRRPAGDAAIILPALGLGAAAPLLAVIDRILADPKAAHDLAEIRAAAAAAGDAPALLEIAPCELVAATLGLNRAAVEKRVKHNALEGIAAFGALPLRDNETALDRYLALREVGQRGPSLGANRRHSHAAAVEVALAHLAQVTGYADPGRLEWDCEARLVEAVPGPLAVGDYTVEVRETVVVTKAGRPLKSVPAAVRGTPEYEAARAWQKNLQAQASRMRTGLVERLVATGGTVGVDELGRLLSLPSGRAMLPDLLWLDSSDHIGLLADVDPTGGLTAVHPFLLFERELLSHWQAEIVRRRVRQPVKQAFRELYVLTPAEREAGVVSRRFAGHTVTGKVAAQLLSGRGWTVHGEYDRHQATRRAGPLTAALDADLHGYFGLSDVVLGGVRFLDGDDEMTLTAVPPIVLSEVMRDLDLVASVAGTEPYEWSPRSNARAELLAALIADLGLDRVHVDGHFAVVRGHRATYRVHLTSGSIHIEPGGYLCIVPAGFGEQPHRRLFLPFADEDRMTAVVLSKVLLLVEDDKITDRSILTQIERASR